MEITQLTYLLSIVLFAGSALLAVWVKYKRILKKYEVILLLLLAIFIPYTAVDYFALQWGAWFYNPDKTSNIYLGTVIETYLFTIAIALVLGSVTLAYASYYDKQRARSHRIKSKK